MRIFETSETVLPLHNSNNFACLQVGVELRWTGWEHTTLTAIQLLSCSAFVRWEFLISWCLNYWVSCKNNNRVYQENCLFFKFSKNINLWLGTRIFILSRTFARTTISFIFTYILHIFLRNTFAIFFSLPLLMHYPNVHLFRGLLSRV